MVSLDLKAHQRGDRSGGIAKQRNREGQRARTKACRSRSPARPPEVEVVLDLIGTAPTDAHVAQYIAAAWEKANCSPDVNLPVFEEFKKGHDDNAVMVRKFHVEMKINPDADLRKLSSER